MRALHTPGHRPEHTAFALIDTARSDEPWAVLTGDSLFVGDIARPDLAVEKEEGARGIFRSLRDQLLALGDDVEVWPGHLGGSLCGGPSIDLKVSSTVGYERRHNELLNVTDEDEFVGRATANLRPQPPNFKAIVELNRGPLRRETVDAHPLTPRQIQQLDAPVIDIRTPMQFDDAHIPGAICNTMLQAGLRHAAGLDRRPRPGGRARRPRRRRRAARRRAGRGRRRVPDRRLPRGRDDELVGGAAADRVDRADHGPGAA